MSKDSRRHKIFCVNSSILSAANDINQSDGDHSYQLTNERYTKADDHGCDRIRKHFPRRNKEH